ncbi:hypothetical protein [Lactobacillus amylovorus]|uniref:hypothetical protein n=1 Tax=Lactobacillus amylovorus TaxID=1604 RepID=UPI0023308ACC|nr:hypothetical protein [Lactobacillus amylovorus]MDB6259359.1 hypothetical protein [Lactobacillus amylovorus]
MINKMRKTEIKEYVDELVKTPGTDATGLTEFEKSFSDEEWDYFMDLLLEKQKLVAAGKLTVPEPLVS